VCLLYGHTFGRWHSSQTSFVLVLSRVYTFLIFSSHIFKNIFSKTQLQNTLLQPSSLNVVRIYFFHLVFGIPQQELASSLATSQLTTASGHKLTFSSESSRQCVQSDSNQSIADIFSLHIPGFLPQALDIFTWIFAAS
jgi:hypothetical protein